MFSRKIWYYTSKSTIAFLFVLCRQPEFVWDHVIMTIIVSESPYHMKFHSPITMHNNIFIYPHFLPTKVPCEVYMMLNAGRNIIAQHLFYCQRHRNHIAALYCTMPVHCNFLRVWLIRINVVGLKFSLRKVGKNFQWRLCNRGSKFHG